MFKSHKSTLCSSYVGYLVQAIVINLPPLLFLTFQRSYNLSLAKISGLIVLEFGLQLLVDALSAVFMDKLNLRVCVVLAHLFSSAGLAMLGILPDILPDPYLGLIISMAVSGAGAGLIEVLISPIVESCPTKSNTAAMSLLHSFYCWGQAAVVLVTTLLIALLSLDNWQYIAFFWAIIPLANAIMFIFVPLYPITESGRSDTFKELFSGTFVLMLIIMICAGASENIMSQWASAFAESALHISKTLGDLLGPCAFAIFMGSARVLYSLLERRLDGKKYIMFCAGLCITAYLLTLLDNPVAALLGCGLCGFSVGVMWPGTYSLTSQQFPNGGIKMFSLLALAGDLGCISGPSAAGLISSAGGGNIQSGFVFALVFPVIIIAAFGVETVIKRKKM